MASQVSDDIDLNSVIKASDAEVLRQIEAATSIDAVLNEVFDGMVQAFTPANASNQSAVIQYDISTPSGVVSYQLDVQNGTCSVSRGADKPARVTLDLSLPDFLRLTLGELDGMQAFMTGKLKLRGDMLFSQTMQSWFVRPN